MGQHVLVWVDSPLAKDQVLLLYSIPIYHSSSSLGVTLVSCAHGTWLLLLLQAFSTSMLSSYVCISGLWVDTPSWQRPSSLEGEIHTYTHAEAVDNQILH